MKGFIRPEVRTLFWQWREAAWGVLLGTIGLWLAVAGFGVQVLFGAVAVVAGVCLIWIGWQRGRFRRAGDGVGHVQVSEGRVVYFAPFMGGTVALSEVSAVAVDARQGPAVLVLSQPGEVDLRIPSDASGAEALIDVFAALPGFDMERLVSGMGRAGHFDTVWQRRTLALH